jgi:outer membrane protein
LRITADNARAETSQALFDLESAVGDEKIARVTLTEAVGAEPSPNIVIDGQNGAPLPEALTMSIDALIDRAMADRPDLMAQASRIRAAKDEVRAAKAEYKPQILLSGSAAQTSVWPTADSAQLGSASQPTWSVPRGHLPQIPRAWFKPSNIHGKVGRKNCTHYRR